MSFVHRLATAVLLSLIALAAQAQSIFTVAGGGSDDGHLATDVGLFGADGLAIDAAGNVYIVERDANLIRRINKDGTIVTVAGNGGAGFTGDGGKATKAALKKPSAIALDANGDIYVADHDSNRIRRIDAATGIISTFAGLARERSDGTIGDNGPASEAFVYAPAGLWLDRGNLYLTEDAYNGNRVRKINLSTKIITTIAGAADGSNGDSGDDGPATAAKFDAPQGIVTDGAGNIFVADTNNSKVRRIAAATGIITTVAGGGTKEGSQSDGGPATDAKLSYPSAVAIDNDGNLLVLEIFGLHRINKNTGIITTITDQLYGFGVGLLVLKNGDILVSEDFTVSRVPAGSAEPVIFAGGGYYVGDGLPATAAVLRNPNGVAVDRDGNLYIADSFNLIVRKVDAKSGIISTYAGDGNYYADHDGEPATQTPIGVPEDLAFDAQGNLFIADVGNSRILRVDRNTGILTFYAGGGQRGQSNEGIPATQAFFDYPVGIALDRDGNLFIAEEFVHKIWKIDARTKTIATFAGTGEEDYTGDGGPATAAKLAGPVDAAVDSAGNVYISDYFNNAIRKVTPGGTISTIAGGNFNNEPPFGDGGPASSAFVSPEHLTIDARNDDLYIADDYSSRIRKIDARSGIISTVAGSGTSYDVDADFTGDNGPAKEAKLNFPFVSSGVFVDSNGNLFIGDTNNNRVRAVFACTAVGAPQITAPANGATNASTAPTLSWNAVPGAFRYDVRVDTVSPPARVIASDLTETTFTPSNLGAGTKYFWSVTAKGDSFCPTVSTATSAIVTFTTAAGCGVGTFDLTAPVDGASGAIAQLAWQAAPGAGSYDLYLGNSTPPPLFEPGLTSTTHAVPSTPGRVFWFVVAHAACDPTKTSTSPVRSYTASAVALCGTSPAITLLSPASGATNVSTAVSLTWSVSQITAAVDVYFGTTSTPPLLRSGVPATTTSLALPALDPGVTYYWRVVAGCSSPFSTPVASFTTQTTCNAPQGVQIIFAPSAVSTGATYSIVWSVASGLDVDGGYLVERSTSPSFSPILDSQVTSSTAASFVAGAPGTIYHRVRAIPACDATKSGPLSDAKSVNITNAPSNIIFTVQPAALVTSLGENIEDRRGAFTLENIGATPAQIIVGQSELPGSRPFFSIAEGGAFITLQPRVPRTFSIQYAGPPNNTAGSYQGVIFAVGVTQPLAVTPYAFVNLKVGGSPAVAPQFVVDGTTADYVAFPGFAGDDDSNRAGREISIRNPGTSAMDLAAEVGPDVWLVPENGWNSQPLAPGATRAFKLFTRRPFAPSGSPLPRYTYFTVRTKDGASSRLLVQDNDRLSVTAGRAAALDVSVRSFIVPDVGNRLRLTNHGGDSVQVELIFTPTGADGFDATAVKRAIIVVPPNDVVTLADPVVQVFGVATGTLGTVEARIPRERLGLITVSAGVVPVVTRGEGARVATPHVIYLPLAPGVTATLTLAETSGLDKATVRAVSDNGQTVTQEIPRYGMKRVSVNPAARWDISVDSGGGSVAGLAKIGSMSVLSRPVTDRVGASSLALAFWKTKPEATVPSVTTVVPVVSGSSSSGNAPSYKTAVGLVAQSASAQFVATFYPSGGGVALNRSINIAAGQTTVYNDVMRELFAVSTPSDGNLFLQGPPNGKVYAVLQQTTSGGTTSLASTLPMPTTLSEALTSATSAAQRPLSLDGLEQSVDSARGTRWMLLLNEVGGAAGFVNVRLYEAGNRSRPIAEKDMQVAANQQLKLDTVFGALGLDSPDRRKDRTNVEVVVTATAGSARLAASALSIDNQSGDTKVFALAPVVGSGNPNINFATPVVTEQPPPASTRRRSVRH